jgi:hypothetical protein
MADPELTPETEPTFDIRKGLKILVIVFAVCTILSVICLSLDSRY